MKIKAAEPPRLAFEIHEQDFVHREVDEISLAYAFRT